MRYSISDTAEYGDYTTGKRIITGRNPEEMKKYLAKSRTNIARKLFENQVNRPYFNARRKMEQRARLSRWAELRKMMS